MFISQDSGGNEGPAFKSKHNNKNSAFDIPYEIRHFQAGRNPRDDKMC